MRVTTSLKQALMGIAITGAMLSSWSAASAQSSSPSIEGTWKITLPTTSLKPVAGVVPFTIEGRQAMAANKKLKSQRKFDDYDITLSRCSTPGVPRLMLTPMRFKIWNRMGVVTFGFEWNRAIRQIDVGGGQLGPKLVPDMAGTSVGHWEGDTLVAVTTDFTGRALIDDLTPQSEGMKVTERIRLIDADTLEDRITIEDATYFTQPWDAVLTYKRQPDVFFPDDICLDRVQAKQPAFPPQ